MIKKIKMVRILLIVWAVAYICKGETASGQIFLGAGPEALGGAGRANNNGMDAHFLNPAGIAFSRGTAVGGAFQEGDLSTSHPVNNYALEVIDNDTNNIISGGFAFVTQRNSYAGNTITNQDISMSFAGHILPTIGLGVLGHRFFTQNTNGPAYVKYNTTVGLLAVPAPWFGLGLVGYDIFTDADQVNITTFAVGTNVVIQDIIRIRADASRPELQNPGHNAILSAGAEFNLGYSLLLRAGGTME